MPVDPLDISTIQNMPMELPPPPPPEPLEGEVKAGAAHPDQEESPSVLQNKHEDPAPAQPAAQMAGEILAGASEPGTVPPSVLGTSSAPKEV